MNDFDIRKMLLFLAEDQDLDPDTAMRILKRILTALQELRRKRSQTLPVAQTPPVNQRVPVDQTLPVAQTPPADQNKKGDDQR